MTSTEGPARSLLPEGPSPTSRGGESLARGVIFGVSALVSVWVLSTALSTYLSALSLAEIALLGQAESEFAKFRDACQVAPHEMLDAATEQRIKDCLLSVLDKNSESGVRFISLSAGRSNTAPPGMARGFVVSVGERMSSPDLDADPARRASPTPIGDRVLYIMPPAHHIHRGAPVVVIEFEPTHANSFKNEGLNSLIAGCLSVLLTLGGAWFMTRLLRERIQAQRAATEQSQLALLGRMSAVMAHELRNPLASAKGHAQLLVEMLDDSANPRAHRKAKLVEHELMRVEQLTHELIEFVRSGRIQRRVCDPSAVAREAARRANLPQVEVITEAAPRRWSLDALAIERVLTNLLRNAAQALDIAPSACSRTITLRVEQRGAFLCFSVRDHGEGFPSDLDAFAPFVTTKTFGTGLGLAICRQVIQAHGGHISTHNHPDGGAVVEALIPDQPTPPADDPQTAREPPKEALTQAKA